MVWTLGGVSVLGVRRGGSPSGSRGQHHATAGVGWTLWPRRPVLGSAPEKEL